MNKMKASQLDLVVRYFLGAVILAAGIMLAFHFWVAPFIGDYPTRAQFSEQFGALNVLFSGAVAIGLVLTTTLQAKGLRHQAESLEHQKEALDHQAEEIKRQVVELRRSAEAQEQANQLSRLSLLMEARRMEMDIVLKRVDGAASEAEREAGLREAEEVLERAGRAVREAA